MSALEPVPRRSHAARRIAIKVLESKDSSGEALPFDTRGLLEAMAYTVICTLALVS